MTKEKGGGGRTFKHIPTHLDSLPSPDPAERPKDSSVHDGRELVALRVLGLVLGRLRRRGRVVVEVGRRGGVEEVLWLGDPGGLRSAPETAELERDLTGGLDVRATRDGCLNMLSGVGGRSDAAGWSSSTVSGAGIQTLAGVGTSAPHDTKLDLFGHSAI